MNFVSETELKKAREDGNEPDEPVDNRPLYHRLKEVRDKKQLEYDEAHALKNQFRGIDDDEADFLVQMDRAKEEQEARKRREEEELLKLAKQQTTVGAHPELPLLLEKPQKVAKNPATNKQASLLSSLVRKRPHSSTEEEPCSSRKVGKNPEEPAVAEEPTDFFNDSYSSITMETAAPLPTIAAADHQLQTSSSSALPLTADPPPSVVASHYNALPETGIRLRNTSRILHLRNFNNWLKSMLIGEFLERLKEEGCPEATVIDLCCGKGGDLRKWNIGKIREIVMTDIAEISLQDCRERFGRMRNRRTGCPPFKAHFVPADLTEVELRDHLPSEAPSRFDLTSCQFALHYSFRTEQGARRMLGNATESLRPGGYFIGTVPDANAIMQYLHRSVDFNFSNRVCSVSIAPDIAHRPPLFGAQIQFHLEGVVDCPEYLCYFPLFKKMLEEEFGMELVYEKSFPDAIQYFLDTRRSEARDLMARMEALETMDKKKLEEKKSENGEGEVEEEYGHAIEKLEGEGGGADEKQKVGTLSKSEWEVLTMYRVFAFRKRQQVVKGDEESQNGE